MHKKNELTAIDQIRNFNKLAETMANTIHQDRNKHFPHLQLFNKLPEYQYFHKMEPIKVEQVKKVQKKVQQKKLSQFILQHNQIMRKTLNKMIQNNTGNIKLLQKSKQFYQKKQLIYNPQPNLHQQFSKIGLGKKTSSQHKFYSTNTQSVYKTPLPERPQKNPIHRQSLHKPDIILFNQKNPGSINPNIRFKKNRNLTIPNLHKDKQKPKVNIIYQNQQEQQVFYPKPIKYFNNTLAQFQSKIHKKQNKKIRIAQQKNFISNYQDYVDQKYLKYCILIRVNMQVNYDYSNSLNKKIDQFKKQMINQYKSIK